MINVETRSGYLNYFHPDKLVEENIFRNAEIEQGDVPLFDEARLRLPDPYWHGHGDVIDCYWKAWRLAFTNIRKATPENGFINHYLNSAFNENLFEWDSIWIQFFARYGIHAFDFQKTLNNFYARQHLDGYICRELLPIPSGEMFHRHDPGSTGPNLLAWSEWEHFRNFGDRERLAQVFPVILAYHHWLRYFRTWQTGTYWHCGLSAGMDNQDRIGCDRDDSEVRISHGHLSWIDANAQALLSARSLVDMAGVLGRLDDVVAERQEIEMLDTWINTTAWDEQIGFYFDVHPGGRTTGFKTIGAFWTLLAEAVPLERQERVVAWLDDPGTFKRPHRVPAIAWDAPGYDPTGCYWRGGVFPPTTYMVLRGLTATGYDQLAYDIASNHLQNVVKVFNQTGTLWEYYAPETVAPGERPDRKAIRDFVGWSGLGPIAILFEYIFGLGPDVPNNCLVWNIPPGTDPFGVNRYPFGRDGLLDLHCPARNNPNDRPDITVRSNCTLDIRLCWSGNTETRRIIPDES